MTTVTLKIRPVRFEADMSYDIVDAEPKQVTYSRVGRMYRPEILTLHYSRYDGEPWKYDSGKIFGWVLKKDGTQSQNQNTERLWLHDSDDWPTWLKVAVANIPERIPS